MERVETVRPPAGARSEITHRGRLFRVEVLRWTDADGRPVEREIVRHPGAVVIVPVLDDGRLVLIRNARVAVEQRLWEFPAGGIDPGEAPIDAARRELAEETGYRAGELETIGHLYTTPGICDEKMHVVVARGLRAGAASPEPGEDMTVHPLQPAAIDELVAGGGIVDGKTLAALLMHRGAAPRVSSVEGDAGGRPARVSDGT